jgi:hypothetical protein
MPSPHMHAPQSCGHELQSSAPLQSPLPQQTAPHIMMAALMQIPSQPTLQQ